MWRWLLIGLSITVLGCGRGGPKVAHVSGRVTLDNKPLANAVVMFSPVPVPGNENPGPDSGGRTDADGRFTLMLTGTTREGAVVGKHKVRIKLIREDDITDETPRKFKDLPGKYSGKETTLSCDVPSEGTKSADFPLFSSK
jgi:hypothetical protein